MRQTIFWTALLVAVLLAACGYWQVLALDTFWCGRVDAFPTIYVISAATLLQLGLFLSVSTSARHRSAYHLTQLAVLPFLALGLCQVFWFHPISLLFLLAAGALPIIVARRAGCGWVRRQPIAAFGVGALTLLGCMTTVAQIPLSMPATIVSNAALVGAVAVGLIAAVAVLLHLDRYVGRHVEAGSIVGSTPNVGDPRTGVAMLPMLPLSLLLLAVLRAKFPDTSYDAYLYKATVPMQMADWRSGDMPIINAMMVGTTFQEMMNATLIMITKDYVSALISTVAFGLLFCIVPLVFALPADARTRERGIAAFAAGMAFTVTEAGIAQGTSHQEPLSLLLLTASLLPGAAWPGFLAMAVMVKINAAFLAPLILLLQLRRGWRAVVAWPPGAVIIVSALLVVAPQIERNLTYSGRLLGQTEVLAGVTDPPGPRQIMVSGGSHFDGLVRGGPWNNAAASACNLLLLKAACATEYHGSEVQGFHVFPGSRAPLLALALCLLLLIPGAIRRTSISLTLASVALYGLAYVLLVSFMSEGRFFLPLSFGFAVLLLVNRSAVADILLDDATAPLRKRVVLAVAVVVLGSDLVPGIFTNVGWMCRRSLFAAERQDMTSPRTPTETFLKTLAGDYRRHCPPPGLSPVILGQHDKLNAPYLGTQLSHYYWTHAMDARFFAADPSRRVGMARAVLALAYVDPDTPSDILGSAVSDFKACFADGDYHVLCSKVLAPEGNGCAQSLFPGRSEAAKP